MNKVILIGRLTKDPELRYTSGNNTAVCSFTLAVPRIKKEETDFINCQAWAKTAEFVGKYFLKGLQVAISGRIQVRTWDGNDGKKNYVTEVVVDEVYFAESKKSDNWQSNTGNKQEGFYPIDDGDELPF